MNDIFKIQNDFVKAVGDIELTPEERHTVEWLKGCEWQTLINLTSIIEKAKKHVE